MLVVATAVAIATSAGLAVPASRADVGSVFFNANNNAAAGQTNLLFNATFTGTENAGLGRSVMPNLTSGDENTATGFQALNAVTIGNRNVATGANALFSNTGGGGNVATGFQALRSNTTGNINVATGDSALSSNTTGLDNVATGANALADNTIGFAHVATGSSALSSNTTGNANVATGKDALAANTTGSRNVAIGTQAGQNLTTGSNNIDIANAGKAGEAGTIRIGNPSKQTATFIAGITGTNVGGTAQPVVVNSNGKLGTAPAPSAGGLSAAEGEWLLATVKRQQRQIERLRARVRGG
jgi:hypothetical protein